MFDDDGSNINFICRSILSVIYKKKTIDGGEQLDISVANAVADLHERLGSGKWSYSLHTGFSLSPELPQKSMITFISPSPDGGVII